MYGTSPYTAVMARSARAARASAEEVLAERSRIVLNDDEAARFVDALDHPERVEARLAWLADKPSVLPS